MLHLMTDQLLYKVGVQCDGDSVAGDLIIESHFVSDILFIIIIL